MKTTKQLQKVAKSIDYEYHQIKIRLKEVQMAIAIKISDSLISEARVYSKVNNRSLTGQIEFWAKIGKCSEENPDLTYEQIKEILLGLEELYSGQKIEYKFG